MSVWVYWCENAMKNWIETLKYVEISLIRVILDREAKQKKMIDFNERFLFVLLKNPKKNELQMVNDRRFTEINAAAH